MLNTLLIRELCAMTAWGKLHDVYVVLPGSASMCAKVGAFTHGNLGKGVGVCKRGSFAHGIGGNSFGVCKKGCFHTRGRRIEDGTMRNAESIAGKGKSGG